MTGRNLPTPVVAGAAALVIAIAGLGLTGWIFDIRLLRNVNSGWGDMGVTTALGLIASAIALIAAERRQEDPMAGRVACFTASAVALLGLASLIPYGWVLAGGSGPAWFETANPMRMAALTAIAFACFGTALRCLCSTPPRSAAAHAIAAPLAALTYLTLITYLFGGTVMRKWFGVTVAFPTSIAFGALCAGLLAQRPEPWFVRAMLKRDAGGIILRRLVPAVLMVPVAVAAARYMAEQAGLLNAAAAETISTVCNGAGLLWVLWLAVRAVNRTEERRQAAETALRDSEARYRALIESSPDAIFVNRAGRVAAVNRAALAMTGARDAGELIGRESLDLFDPDCRPVIRERIERVLAGGAVSPQEQRVVRLDGGIVHVEGIAALIEYDGSPALQVILRDISERKRSEEELRERREWLRVALTSIGDAVLACDTAGRIRFLNPVAAELTGWPEQDALGRPVGEVFRVVNEQTGEPGDDIAARVLCEGRVVVLANHSALIRRDGREIPIEDSAAPIMDAAGRVSGVVLVFHDVAEKRRAQRALEESERRVRLKLESVLSPDGDVGKLELGDVVDVEALQSLLQDFYDLARVPLAIIDRTGKVLVGAGWQEVCTSYHRVNPDSCRHCIESDTQLAGGVAAGQFKLYKCKNNMWDMATPLIIGGRHVGNLFSGQFFFVDEVPDEMLFRAQAAEYGFDEQGYMQALGRVPRMRREDVEKGMSFLMKLGNMISQLSYSNIKLARSLAERGNLMESLAEGKDRLSRAQEIGHLGSWELNLISNTLTWSDEAYRIFGLEPQEFGATYEAFLAVVHPDDRAAVDAAYSGSLRDGRSSYEIEHRVVRRGTGEVRWVLEKCEHVRDAAGTLVRSIGMVLDVTARKRADEAVRQSEALYRAIARNLPDGSVYLVDAGLRVVAAEGSLMPRIGHVREAMEGRSVPDAAAGEFGRVAEERFRRALAGESASYEGEYAGRVIWSQYAPMRDEGGAVAGAISLWLDVTQRKRVEEQMRHAQKLESIGLLAGGIAHDFNNLLVAVMGNASLAKDMVPADSPVAPALDQIVKAGEQAAHLTRQMLAYAGKGRFVYEPVNLSRLFEENRELLESSIPKKVALRLNLAAGVPPVETDRGQMQQVFMNLVINAGEAFADGPGEVAVSTGETHLDSRFISERLGGWTLTPGKYVYFEVSDNGPGMDAATQAKIFDPFFTTKFQGRGLGLAAVAGIVRAHGGAIDVSSAPGAGATFRVLLPAMAAAPAPARGAAQPDAEDDLRGSGCVLVVDDERFIRDLAKTSLERQGYEVIGAADGRAAVEALRTARDRIRLVVLDLSMPGMSGQEVLPFLREIRPELDVIVSSGYSAAETLELFDGTRIAGFVQKPYTVRTLATEVRLVLSRQRRTRAAPAD